MIDIDMPDDKQTGVVSIFALSLLIIDSDWSIRHFRRIFPGCVEVQFRPAKQDVAVFDIRRPSQDISITMIPAVAHDHP